jgi:CBS domain-containing protein
MRAVDVMVRGVVTVCPDTDVAGAIRLLAEHDVSALPVRLSIRQEIWLAFLARPI